MTTRTSLRASLTVSVRTLALLLASTVCTLSACSSSGGGPDVSGVDTAGTDTGGRDAGQDTAPVLDLAVTDVPATPDTTTRDVPVPQDVTADPVVPVDTVACDNGNIDTMDTSQAGLVAFAQSGAYMCWLAEAAVHPSAGPHAQTGVRTFFNDKAVAGLSGGTGVLPRGAILLKELYGSGGIAGYAVDLKIQDGEGPDTWLFYEGFLPSGNGYYGVANGTCTGCHSQGVDYVRSALPR